MSTPNGFFQLLVRCPRCDARNAVDVRKQGLARRVRCGRCGEPLPRRLPAPLLLMVVSTLVVVLGLTHFAVSAVRERQATDRRARVERLLDDGRGADAVGLLPAKRGPSSEDGQLARRVARALAAPVLAADHDTTGGSGAIEAAIDLGDRLVEKHQDDLPEVLAVLDEPLRRLQARKVALEIVAVAAAHAAAPVPDLVKVDRALEDATVQALDSPPEVAAAVEMLAPGIRARAALAKARSLVAKRPQDARALLQSTAQRLPAPAPSGRHVVPVVPELAPAPLIEQLGRFRSAVSSRDVQALQALVHARPAPDASAGARDEFDRELRRACQALASLQADKASREWDPEARATQLLQAVTCDEILPPAFVKDVRAAFAEGLVEAARRGGSLEDALLAWDGVEVPRRDRDLAALGCLAEQRGAHAVAVLAWSRVQQPATLALLARCADENVEPLPPATTPMLDYPAGTP